MDGDIYVACYVVLGKSGVVFAVKLYPAGATTNSQDGVTDIGKCLPVLEEMVRQEMPLLVSSFGTLHPWSTIDLLIGVLIHVGSLYLTICWTVVLVSNLFLFLAFCCTVLWNSYGYLWFFLQVHGEVTDPHVDTFDREKVFIDRILAPLVQKLPQLKIVMEHITTMDAVNFIESCEGAALLLEWHYTLALFYDCNTFMFPGHVAATVTPQHLLLNRNALFQGGLQPHNYCLPILKREIHSMLQSPFNKKLPVATNVQWYFFWFKMTNHFLSNYENQFLNMHDDNHFGSKCEQIFHHQYITRPITMFLSYIFLLPG